MDLFTLILGKNISGGSGSGGVEYSSIVYNEDNTVTLTEKDGTVHTMVCTYENGKLIGVTYDGEAIDLAYADDLLLSVSGASVDMSKAPATSDVFVITASGAISNCTVDKPYIEILSAAQAGKTIILLFPKPFLTEYWILSPYRINNDRSGTFRCITPSDLEYEGDAEYILFVTIYPDNTVQAREERFIKELDHRITFKADGQDYQIITVKDGQSVSAPSPNPTSESGTFTGWLNALSGESVTFPLTPTEDLWLNAYFSEL